MRRQNQPHASDALDVARGKAARVETADHRAHAGAGDRVDGDVQVLEHFQHADVRGAACAATREHEADAQAMVFGACRAGR